MRIRAAEHMCKTRRKRPSKKRERLPVSSKRYRKVQFCHGKPCFLQQKRDLTFEVLIAVVTRVFELLALKESILR